MVSPPTELVCYMPKPNLCDVLVPLDMNLDGFSSGLCDTAGSLSINQEFSSIVEELLKKALGVIDGGMSRYYPVSRSQTYIFHFVHHQNVLMVLVFVKGFISVL